MKGKLTKTSTKRWAIECDEEPFEELTSGSPVEVKIGRHWISGRVEYLHPPSGEGRYALLVPFENDPECEQIVELKKGWIARTP